MRREPHPGAQCRRQGLNSGQTEAEADAPVVPGAPAAVSPLGLLCSVPYVRLGLQVDGVQLNFPASVFH